MENNYRSGKITKTYFVQSLKDFKRLDEVISLMPSFAAGKKPGEEFTDTYYETEDEFLKQMDVTVRLRIYKDRQILSVKYGPDALSKQDDAFKDPVSEKEMEAKEDLFGGENLMFIEDKINAIYGSRMQIDILRKLRHMKPVYTIKTKRTILDVNHNSGFRTDVYFDDVLYSNVTKQISYKDLILDITMTSPGTRFNQDMLNIFLNKLRERVVLVPMEDSKYVTAKLMTRFNK